MGPVGVENKVGRHTMQAANKSRTESIEIVLTTVPNPPQARGLKSAPKTRKGRLTQNVGIVARKAIGRVSVGRNKPIPTKLYRAKERQRGVKGCTMQKAPNEPEMDRVQLS